MFNPDSITPIKPPIRGVEGQNSKDRPQGLPRSDKNFKRMVQSSDPDQKKQVDPALDKEEDVAVEEQAASQSIFDLSANKNKKTAKASKRTSALDTPPDAQTYRLRNKDIEIPSNLQDLDTEMAQMDDLLDSQSNELANLDADSEAINAQNQFAALEAGKKANLSKNVNLHAPDTLALETDATVPFSKEDELNAGNNKDRFSSRSDVQENHDLSYLNLFQPVNAAERHASVNDNSVSVPARSMQEIVDQLVESMRTLKTEGKQETIITLQYPPILKGADIHLTSFDADKVRFDIAFTNLTQEGKLFLDQRLQKDALTLALEQKGFVVQTLVTTTQSEILPSQGPAYQNFARNNRGDQEQQQQQGQREQPNDGENETT